MTSGVLSRYITTRRGVARTSFADPKRCDARACLMVPPASCVGDEETAQNIKRLDFLLEKLHNYCIILITLNRVLFFLPSNFIGLTE